MVQRSSHHCQPAGWSGRLVGISDYSVQLLSRSIPQLEPTTAKLRTGNKCSIPNFDGTGKSVMVKVGGIIVSTSSAYAAVTVSMSNK